MNTPTPETDWAHTAVGRIATSDETRALARRYCGPNSLGITPEQVHAQALDMLWRRRHTTEVYDPDGFVRSRLAWAYRGLVKQRLALTRRETSADPTGLGSHLTVADPEGLVPCAEWIRDIQTAVTRRLGELGPCDDTKARALATILNLLAISANDGCLPSVAPQRSDRLEESERDRLAATWMADPALRSVGDSPDSADSASTRKRRQRLMDIVRDEFALVLAQLTSDSEPGAASDAERSALVAA